jgi:hypothetical protein
MDDTVKEARELYDDAVSADRENREEAEKDMRFLAGDQWPELIKRDREANGRPMLTLPRLNQYERQITGDMRLNPPSIKVRPVDSSGDPQTAKTFTGLIRNIEAQSNGQRAYLTAGANAVRCGEGWFGLLYDYVQDGFEMELAFRRFASPFAVVPDPNAEEPSCGDMEYAFVPTLIHKTAFRKMYPKASLVGWDSGDIWGPWREGDFVRVAEYWRRIPTKRRLVLLQDQTVLDVTDWEDTRLQGLPILRERQADSYRVEMRKLTGVEELEDPHEWPGCMIPLVRVVGEEVNIGDRCIRFGIIRQARDAQTLYNIQRTAMAEAVAMAPKAKWIVTDRMISGREGLWSNANLNNAAYLTYTPDPAAPGGMPQRIAPEIPSQALLTDVQAAAQDIEATIGIYRESLGKESNAVSGKAILSRQREGDVGTYLFADNLADAVMQAGRILIDVLPKVYDTERQARLLLEDGTEEFVPINSMSMDPVTGQIKMVNDIRVGRYDVVSSVGPSFSTKREEEREMLMAMGQANPMFLDIGADILVKNMDSPGSEELHKRLRKMAIQKGYAEPGEDDPPPPQPQPDPNTLLAMAEIEKAKAAQAKVQADTAIKTEEIKIEQAKLLLEAEKVKAQHASVMIEAERADTERAASEVKSANDTQATRAKVAQTMSSMVDTVLQRHSTQVQQHLQAREQATITPIGENIGRMADEFGKSMQATLARMEDVTASLNAIGQRVEQVAADVSAPREIVRDPKTGRPTGVKVGNRVRSIARGPDGRASGLQ